MDTLNATVAIITGASSGIGEGIAKMLAAEGVKVALGSYAGLLILGSHFFMRMTSPCSKSFMGPVVPSQRLASSANLRNNQEMPEKGRISSPSQVYLPLREKEIRDFNTTQGKTVMRMTPEAFHTWSQRLRLSSKPKHALASALQNVILWGKRALPLCGKPPAVLLLK
jgi:hypothetical protein